MATLLALSAVRRGAAARSALTRHAAASSSGMCTGSAPLATNTRPGAASAVAAASASRFVSTTPAARAAAPGSLVAEGNYRRRRTIPPPPPGRPPFRRPPPSSVLLLSGFVGVVSYIVYSWRKRSSGSGEDGADAHTPQFTGSLQPQAGPVTPGTQCSAAVIVALPPSAYAVPAADSAAAGSDAAAGGDAAATAPIVGVARQVAELQEALAAETVDVSSLVTVAFSPAAWSALSPHEAKGCANFGLTARQGPHGALPATGGDMLWHVQASTRSACEAAVKRLSATLPAGSSTSVTYGEDHMGEGRDLTGFHLGQANPGSVAEREAAAVEAATGGSYVLAQKWVHNMDKVKSTPPELLEAAVGRTLAEGAQLGSTPVGAGDSIAAAVESGLPASSHVARMVSMTKDGRKVDLVRHHLPFVGDTKGGDSQASTAGLFFLGYASHPAKLFHLLDRMVGVGGVSDVLDEAAYTVPEAATAATDGTSGEQATGSGAVADALMRLSRCETGQVFYVPSVVQLRALR